MKRNKIFRNASILAVAMVMLLTAGCSAGQKPTEQSQSESTAKTELVVMAAASLTDVTKELSTLFHQSHGEIQLTFNYGSSGALQTQIEEGAPADLFLSAAAKQMNALEEKGLTDKQSRKDLLENKVVLIVPKGSTAELRSFEDCGTDKVKMIALGDVKSVPVGQYAQEIFESLKISDVVTAKANYATDVRQVLTWVESGEVDCGVVYATDAAISDEVEVVASAPEGSHKAVIYPAAILKASQNQEAAKAFLDFLSTKEAAAIFEKYGFLPL